MRLLLLFAAATVVIQAPAKAETVEQFYRNKTITMYVGTGPGGGAVSGYPMALARVIRKYIPGNPNLVVAHMPGAGGIKAATYIERVAPQDGTAWGFITRGFMLAPLLKLPQADFQPAKFNWIGSPARTVSMGVVWNAHTRFAPSRRPCSRRSWSAPPRSRRTRASIPARSTRSPAPGSRS
jgi:tripartite-type tricarboxylate transporter receptor subunit TctC